MNMQNLPPQKSSKGLIIGVVIGAFLLLMFFIIAVIGGVAYWHWTTHVNS